MSGTSFGTVVLHVAPESAIGGPLARWCETGDEIELDVPAPHGAAGFRGRESHAVYRSFSRPLRNTTADTAACSWSTSRRPIWVATSISCGSRQDRHSCLSI